MYGTTSTLRLGLVSESDIVFRCTVHSILPLLFLLKQIKIRKWSGIYWKVVHLDSLPNSVEKNYVIGMEFCT
jgi:hypothetical protein